MEAPPPNSDVHPPAGFVSLADPRRNELMIEALKVGLATPGEHRLFRAGKLPGLFPARTGLASEMALLAIRDGLIETVRTETKGKLVTEWVRTTPKAVEFVHDHGSPRSILRELKSVLNTTREGVPAFLAEARTEIAALSANFEARATAILSLLDDLAKRCETALRRADTTASLIAAPVARVVPWAMDVLEYLDKRSASGATNDCPLPELFRAVGLRVSDLTLAAFHHGVKRLHDVRVLRLVPATETAEPEYTIVVDGKLMYAVGR